MQIGKHGKHGSSSGRDQAGTRKDSKRKERYVVQSTCLGTYNHMF